MNVGLKTQILPAGEAAVAAAVRCFAEGGLGRSGRGGRRFKSCHSDQTFNDL